MWQWGSCDRTHGKVAIFLAIFAIYSLNSGTYSRRSPGGIKGAQAGRRRQFPSALNRDARVLMFHRCDTLVADPKGRGKKKKPRTGGARGSSLGVAMPDPL